LSEGDGHGESSNYRSRGYGCFPRDLAQPTHGSSRLKYAHGTEIDQGNLSVSRIPALDDRDQVGRGAIPELPDAFSGIEDELITHLKTLTIKCEGADKATWKVKQKTITKRCCEIVIYVTASEGTLSENFVYRLYSEEYLICIIKEINESNIYQIHYSAKMPIIGDRWRTGKCGPDGKLGRTLTFTAELKPKESDTRRRLLRELQALGK